MMAITKRLRLFPFLFLVFGLIHVHTIHRNDALNETHQTFTLPLLKQKRKINYCVAIDSNVSRFHPDKTPIGFHNIKTPRSYDPQIPKRYHVIWIGKEKKPPMAQIQNCKALNADWEFYFWNDESIRHHKEFFTLELTKKNEILVQADLLRLEVLYLYGGIFVDSDTVCRRPFSGLFENGFLDGIEFFAAEENEHIEWLNGMVANGLIGSSRYNPDVYSILCELPKIKFTTAWNTSGPCLLSQVAFGRYPRYCPKLEFDFVANKTKKKLLSSELFYPLHYTGGYFGPRNITEVMQEAYTHQLWGSTYGDYDM